MDPAGLAIDFAIGVALGAATGLPIGLVNLAILEGAARRGLGHGIGIASGGAAADSVHAWLGVAGVGVLLSGHPSAGPALFAMAGVVVSVYGVVLWRSSGAATDTARPRSGRGFTIGLALTLPNPGALAAWGVVGTLLAPTTYLEAGFVAAGVGLGSFGWFSLLARLAAGGRALRPRTSKLTVRLLAAVFVGFGVYALARAAVTMVTSG